MSSDARWEDLDSATEAAAELVRRGQASDPLVGEVVKTWAQRAEASTRTSTWTDRLERDDIVGEASIWALEQLAEYRPGQDDTEGTASGFLASRLTWFSSKARRDSSLLVTKADFKVAGILAALRERYHREGRNPGLREIREDIRAEALTQYRASISQADPELDTAELNKRAVKRLAKDGIDKSLELLPELLSASSGTVSLDQPLSDDAETTLGDSLTIAASDDQQAQAAEQYADMLALLALGQEQWARTALAVRGGSDSEGVVDDSTLEALAQETGHSAAELRDIIRLSKARVHSPHAQWAHLGADARILTL